MVNSQKVSIVNGQTSRSINRFSSINFEIILLAYVVAFLISPPIYVNNVQRLFVCCVCGILLLLSIRKGISITNVISLYFILITTVMFWNNNQLHKILLFIPIYILIFFINIMEKTQKKGFESFKVPFWICLILFPLWNIITIIEFAKIPDIARLLAGSGAVDEAYYASRGIGGYGLVYSVVLIPALMIVLLKSKIVWKVHEKLLFVINLLSSFVLILMSGYFIATALMVATLFFILIISPNIRTRFFQVFLGILIIALIIIFLNNILDLLMEMLEGTMYFNKVNDIKESINSGSSSGTMEARMVKYSQSITTIVKHPILGDMSNIGGHSVILDMLARFGLLAGVLFFYVYFKLISIYLEANKYNRDGLYIASIMFYITVFTFNTVSFTIIPVICIIVPYVMTIVNYTEESYEIQ